MNKLSIFCKYYHHQLEKRMMRMRKYWVFATIISLIVISIISIYYIYVILMNKSNNEINLDEMARVTVENGVNTFAPTITTSTSQEKVSPNATLVIKKHYSKCGHTTKEYAEIPEEFVNMDEEEIALRDDIEANFECPYEIYNPDEGIHYRGYHKGTSIEEALNEIYEPTNKKYKKDDVIFQPYRDSDASIYEPEEIFKFEYLKTINLILREDFPEYYPD